MVGRRLDSRRQQLYLFLNLNQAQPVLSGSTKLCRILTTYNLHLALTHSFKSIWLAYNQIKSSTLMFDSIHMQQETDWRRQTKNIRGVLTKSRSHEDIEAVKHILFAILSCMESPINFFKFLLITSTQVQKQINVYIINKKWHQFTLGAFYSKQKQIHSKW